MKPEQLFPLGFEELKSGLSFIRTIRALPAAGYPDAEVVDNLGRTTYVEIKATTRPNEGSPRDFFFTPLGNTRAKVTKDGRHLLLSFITREPEARKFNVIGWKLADLSKIIVSMKPEFNADNLEIYKKEAIIAQRDLQDISR